MSDTTTPPPQFTSALGDPFDPAGVSNLHQPGMLGISPDVWRSLANFGSNMATSANARTPGGFLANGTGFAGPFAAAVGQSNQQGLERGQVLSNMALQRAHAQNLQFQNYMNALQIPLLQAKQQMQMDFLHNPQQFMQQYGLNGPTFGEGASQQADKGDQNSGVPFAANNPLNMRYVGQDGATNTKGFAAFPTPEAGKAATDSLFDRYAQSGVNSLRGLISKWAPPSENNTDAYIAHVSKQTGIDPDQQIDLTSPAVKAVVQHSMAGFEGNKNANVPQAFQVAQAGNGPIPAPSNAVGNLGLVKKPNGDIGTPLPQQQAQTAPAPMQMQQTMAQPGQAQALAAQWQARANRALQQANLIETMHGMGLPIVGDPQSLRQQAQTFTENALKLQSVGPTEQEKAANTITTDRFGNMYKGTTYLGRGSEVKEVWNPQTGRYEWGDVGGVGIGAQNPAIGSGEAGTSSGMAAKPGPGEVEASKLPVEVQKGFIDHDNKIVEDDLSHVIDNVTPAKQQLMQLRGLVDDAHTGAAGPFRSEMRNWVQTFAPDFVSQMIGGDAAPAQEFDKIALMGAGKQERGDLGARGGFRAIEMYRNANPSMDKQPTANRDMANALLISHQYHEDYAMGATGYFNNQVQSVLNANGGQTKYSKLSNYDSQFIKTMRPELYAAAIGAINGKPYNEWAKGLSNKQMQIVGGIVQRADPSAVVDIQGHQVPVVNFKTTIGPSDIAGTGGPGAG